VIFNAVINLVSFQSWAAFIFRTAPLPYPTIIPERAVRPERYHRLYHEERSRKEMEIVEDGCKDCAKRRCCEPEPNPASTTTQPSKQAHETEAAYQRKRWDHLDARVLCRSGYIRFPWP
jgi:hypothetical protein